LTALTLHLSRLKQSVSEPWNGKIAFEFLELTRISFLHKQVLKAGYKRRIQIEGAINLSPVYYLSNSEKISKCLIIIKMAKVRAFL